jgi:hypothetical protein
MALIVPAASRSFLSWTRAERLSGAGRGGLRGGKLVWPHTERCGPFCALAGSVSGICTGRKNISLCVQIMPSTLTLKVLFLGLRASTIIPLLSYLFVVGFGTDTVWPAITSGLYVLCRFAELRLYMIPFAVLTLLLTDPSSFSGLRP